MKSKNIVLRIGTSSVISVFQPRFVKSYDQYQQSIRPSVLGEWTMTESDCLLR